jgi:uncharacterized Zn finger protein
MQVLDRKQTIKCLSGREGSYEAYFICPVCGDEWSHVREVFTRLGYDRDEAAIYEGTPVKEYSDGWRRSAVVVVVDGECGHVWNFIIQQHKGVNFLRIEAETNQDSTSTRWD